MNNASNVRFISEKIQRFLIRQTKTPGWDFSNAPDPRQEAQVEHKMPSLIWTYVLALISNQPTLRDVEAMTKELSPVGRALVEKPKSDTTLYEVVKRLETEYYLSKLVQQIRQWQRRQINWRPTARAVALRGGDRGREEPGHPGSRRGRHRTEAHQRQQQVGQTRRRAEEIRAALLSAAGVG